MRRWVALALLIAVDGTVPALAIPALQRELAPTAAQVLWIGDIYSFVLGGLLVKITVSGDSIGGLLRHEILAPPVPSRARHLP